MGLSQLAPGRFKTFCDRKFSKSDVLALPLHDASHLFDAIKWSHQVASDFWTCSKFRGNTRRFKLLHWVSRTCAQYCTTFYQLARVWHEFLRSQDGSHLCMRLLYGHGSVVRHVADDLTALYYRCTSLPHQYIYPVKASYFSDKTWLSRENHACCCTNTSSPDHCGAYAEYQTITTRTTRTHDGSHDRTFGVRPIDHLTTRTMSLHRTTLAFITQRTHRDVRHIARFITYHCTTLA